MIKELLPCGSVIMLKGGVKKLMVIGIKVATDEQPEKFYDYIGVLYPEGYIGAQSCFLFNHDDINDVIFVGYSNPERADFMDFIEEEFQKEQQREEKINV